MHLPGQARRCPPRACSRHPVGGAHRAVSLPSRMCPTARCDPAVRLCRAKLQRLVGRRRGSELTRAALRLDVCPSAARIVASTFSASLSHPARADPHSPPARLGRHRSRPHRPRIADGSRPASPQHIVATPRGHVAHRPSAAERRVALTACMTRRGGASRSVVLSGESSRPRASPRMSRRPRTISRQVF